MDGDVLFTPDVAGKVSLSEGTSRTFPLKDDRCNRLEIRHRTHPFRGKGFREAQMHIECPPAPLVVRGL